MFNIFIQFHVNYSFINIQLLYRKINSKQYTHVVVVIVMHIVIM